MTYITKPTNKDSCQTTFSLDYKKELHFHETHFCDFVTPPGFEPESKV